MKFSLSRQISLVLFFCGAIHLALQIKVSPPATMVSPLQSPSHGLLTEGELSTSPLAYSEQAEGTTVSAILSEIKSGSEDPSLYLDLANLYVLNHDQPNRSADILELAITNNVANEEVFERYVELVEMEQIPRERAIAFLNGIPKKNEHPQVLLALAQSLLLNKQKAPAKHQLERLSDAHRQSINFNYRLGVAWAALGNQTKAHEIFETLASTNPESEIESINRDLSVQWLESN